MATPSTCSPTTARWWPTVSNGPEAPRVRTVVEKPWFSGLFRIRAGQVAGEGGARGFVGDDLRGVEAHQFVGKDDPLLGGVQVVVGYSPGAVAAGLEVGGGDADIRWRGGEVGIQLGDHPVDAEAGVVDIVDDQDAARR